MKFADFFRTKSDLLLENHKLKKELETLMIDYAILESKYDELQDVYSITASELIALRQQRNKENK